MKTLRFALCIAAILSVCAPVRGDDLFYEDGRMTKGVRTFTWQGKSLENVQLGVWRPDGVEVFHGAKGKGSGRVLVPVKDLPALWQKELWKRVAGKLKPAGAAAAVEGQLVTALGLSAPEVMAPRAVPVNGKKADGTAFSGWVLAGNAAGVLIVTQSGAGWVPDKGLQGAAEVRKELMLATNYKAWLAERQDVSRLAVAAAAEAVPVVKSDTDAAQRKAIIAEAKKKWEEAHPKPATELPTALKQPAAGGQFDPFTR